MAGTFGGVSGHWRPNGWEPRPPKLKYERQNSHISQMVLKGQERYQTVRLVLLSKYIYTWVYDGNCRRLSRKQLV